MRALFAERFAGETRDHWESVFAGSDACVAPVLDMTESPNHPQNRARQNFVDVGGVVQPGPAPRFEMTPAPPTRSPSTPGDSTDVVLEALGLSKSEIGKLRHQSVVY